MKYFVLLTGLIFVCYLLGFIKKPEKYQWMDRNYTTAIKGFSIWTVVWAHSGAMLSVGGIQFVAGIGVALFLMCSGYGLEISYEKNGLHAVKNLPYIVSNVMALLTCLPMAIGIMVFGKSFSGLFENKMLATTGMISYEIYLVHAFTLGMIKPSVVSVIAFVVVTVTLAYATYFTIGKMKNGRFNNYYPHKE